MTPDSPKTGSPVVDYLLKEVSFSTCDNRFFGELEKEMLIPNNVNIYGNIKNVNSLKGHKLRVEFPEESAIGYIKQPTSNVVADHKRVLTYKLEDLLNFDAYWWLPLPTETEFSLMLNLLPPFPTLNPIDLQISCRPDIVGGLQAEVNTNIRIQADEQIDQLALRIGAPMSYPGVSMTISQFSGDNHPGPRNTINVPEKGFPYPQLGLKKGQTLEYKATTKITADPSSMTSLRCQQDILSTRLVLLSESTPSAVPCSVSILDEQDRQIPVAKTVRSTILQANAQVMYSPFSIRKEAKPEQRERLLVVPAQ